MPAAGVFGVLASLSGHRLGVVLVSACFGGISIGSYVCTSHCAYLHTVGIPCTALHTYIQWRWDSACSHLCVSVTFPLQCVVIIVGVIVCEISTGIFIELKKNEASVSPSVVSW